MQVPGQAGARPPLPQGERRGRQGKHHRQVVQGRNFQEDQPGVQKEPAHARNWAGGGVIGHTLYCQIKLHCLMLRINCRKLLKLLTDRNADFECEILMT